MKPDALKDLSPEQLLASPVAKLLYKTWAGRSLAYRKIDRYMDGDHDLQFATQKFTNAFGGLFREFSENLFPVVITSLSDYLQFETKSPITCDDEAAQTQLDDWLTMQGFPVLGGQTHSDAYEYGDSYVALGLDDEDNLRMYRQDSRQCSVVYDPVRPDRIMAAFKLWQDPITSWFLLNITTRWATYHYVASKSRSTPKLVAFEPYEDQFDTPPIVPHGIEGVCPVWHFPNDPDASNQGKSALKSVFPLQDALNKTECDKLVAGEFQSFRQRWATGIEMEIDTNTGKPIPPYIPAVDRLFISPSENAKFGDFAPIDITQFIEAGRAIRLSIASVTGIPAHHLVAQTTDFPSGEAIKMAELPLLLKTRDRQLCWGAVWQAIASYWFTATGKPVPSNLKVDWVDMTPRDKMNESQGDLNEANASTIWNELGVPKRQLLIEKGYTAEQVTAFESEIQEEQEKDASNAADAMAKQLNAAPVIPNNNQSASKGNGQGGNGPGATGQGGN
jgi:hypothetical protein